MIMVIYWAYNDGALIGTSKTRQEAVDIIKEDMGKHGIEHDDLCAEISYSAYEVSSEFRYEPPSDITGTLVKVGE